MFSGEIMSTFKAIKFIVSSQHTNETFYDSTTAYTTLTIINEREREGREKKRERGEREKERERE